MPKFKSDFFSCDKDEKVKIDNEKKIKVKILFIFKNIVKI